MSRGRPSVTVRFGGVLAHGAGGASWRVRAASVAEVLAAVEDGFGPEFSATARRALILVNGKQVAPGWNRERGLHAGDKIDIIPMMAGG